MVMKRELYSDSESDYEEENEDEDVKPIITPTKKIKSKSTPVKKTPSSSTDTTRSSTTPKVLDPSSSSSSSSSSLSPSKKFKVDPNAKRTIAEEIINVGIKGIDVEVLARATGLTVQQVRSQIAGGGRANLRRQLMELAKSL